MRKVWQWFWVTLAFALTVHLAPAQASPYNLYVLKAQSLTATAQCTPVLPLNGLTAGNSTVGSSYSAGSVTLAGTGLTTATFNVQGSYDNGATFVALLLSSNTSPGTTATSITATANGVWQFALASVSHIKICTTGTFTATSIALTVSLTPNGTVSRNNGSGSGNFNPGGTPQPNYVPIGIDGSAYAWGQLTQDDIAPGFTINSFAGGSTVEIGATVSNPAFTATYSATPASAAITNTDSVSSPTNLTTPFTSGTITGSFHHTAMATVTFTLTAVGAVTKTATTAINWLPRSFGGVGAAGATSSVTASGTNAILSNSASLASNGLAASQVGLTFGAYSPSAQKIYLLLIGGSHTFKDAVTGFSFAFNSPTSISFVNAQGATVSMFLYESTNTLTGSFSVMVAS